MSPINSVCACYGEDEHNRQACLCLKKKSMTDSTKFRKPFGQRPYPDKSK